VPIVPLVIYGTFEVFPKNRNELRTFQPIHARILPPMMPEDYRGKPGKMKDDAYKLMTETLNEIRSQHYIGTTAGAAEPLVGTKKD
jgi:hypothetical protein